MSAARPTPARLTSAATVKLPRWGLVALCLLYILPGLFGRDPWKNDDAAGLGIMLTMAQGAFSDWLAPNIGGIAITREGPLAFWAGAICIHLFGWLIGRHEAGQLASVFWFLLTSSSVWYATYLLGRRTEAQPLSLPFGGQPEGRDYGRMLADGALLLLLGTWGIVFRTHETSGEPALLALSAFALYAVVRGLDQPRAGATQLGCALAGLFLCRGLPVMLSVSAAVAWLAWRDRHQSHGVQIRWMLLITLPIAVLIPAVWLYAVFQVQPTWLTAWWMGHQQNFGLPSLAAVVQTARNFPWYAWPGIIFALWALWVWRTYRDAAHQRIPIAFVVTWLLSLSMIAHLGDSHLLRIMPPVVLLAAFALPTLRRGAVNALDWFALMSFSFGLALLWLGWIAMQTGFPPKIAKNFARLTPGFTPEFSWIALSIALIGTAAWIALAVWRIAMRPTVLWRAVVLSSGGLIVCHLILMTLWLPSINYARTYRDVSAKLAHVLQLTGDTNAHTCMTARNVGLAQLASFIYFNDLKFSLNNDCPLLLLQDRVDWSADDQLPTGHWVPVWEGRRASDKDERFRLFRKIPLE